MEEIFEKDSNRYLLHLFIYGANDQNQEEAEVECHSLNKFKLAGKYILYIYTTER